MTRHIIALIAALALCGCALARYSGEDGDYLRRVEQGGVATDFTIPAEQAPEAREKAAWFIANYATLGLNVATGTMVTSHFPPKPDRRIFNYTVRFLSQGDRVRVIVQCWSYSRNFAAERESRNAAILADFLQGGKLRGIYVFN